VHPLRYRDSSSGVMSVGVLRRNTITAIQGVTSVAELWRLSREALKAAVTGATGGKGKLADVTVAAPVDGRTCLVPSEAFSLTGGDIVRISIAEVGVLTTGVVRGPEAMSWLVHVTDVPGRPTAGHLAPATCREALPS
jgi:fumarylacetoacetate (FAA) hydrolase family protein